MSKKKPNIILITADQFRYDGIGKHNNPVISTPTLNQWAREGIDFHNAYSATPTCIPARASLMSGLSQKSTGIVGYDERAGRNFPVTMAEEFTKHGYYTKAIGKMHTHPRRALFGFHHIELHDGYFYDTRKHNLSYSDSYEGVDDYLQFLKDEKRAPHDITDMTLNPNSWVARPWAYDEDLHPTNWATTRAIDFLRTKDPTKPFFLFLSYVRPHSPLDPPQRYFDMYLRRLDDDVEPIIGNWAKPSQTNPVYSLDALTGSLDPDDYRDMLAGYYGNISHIDDQLNRFILHLQEAGELENSIILFTSDHADQLGEHGLYRKGFAYQGSIHIPLVIYDPGRWLGHDINKNIDEIVELRDILPSMIDFATGESIDNIDGKSVKELIHNSSDNIVWRDYLHGEHTLGDWSQHFILTKDWKYIWFSQTGEEQLFNIGKDPKELNNLIESADDKILDELRQLLIDELKDRAEGFVEDNKLISGRPLRSLLPINEEYKIEGFNN